MDTKGLVFGNCTDEDKIAKVIELRKEDKSYFICIYCQKIDNGFGAYIGGGWACSSECYDRELETLLSGKGK